MRELFLALSELEDRLVQAYGVSLNEAMVLCGIGHETVTASAIASRTGLLASHASKIIGGVEKKGLIMRRMGEQDKRQMHFTLTEDGVSLLRHIKEQGVDFPESLLNMLSPYVFSEERVDR